MDLEKYINHSKSNGKEIWLHNLPNDETLFDVIDNLRRRYNNLRYTFVINQNIRITGITIDRDVDFSYCIFKNEDEIEKFGKMQKGPLIIFNKVEFNGSVSFLKSNVYKAKFEEVKFQGNKYNDFGRCFFDTIEFENVKFNGENRFDASKVKNISFNRVEFNGSVSFLESKLYEAEFKNINFNFSTHFNNSEIEKLSFEDTTFKGNTNFREISFNGEAKFLNCTFTSLQNDTFGEVSFSGSTFKQKVEFLESKFQIKTSFSYFEKKDELRLEATNFKDKVDFKDSVFTKEADFSETIFEGDTNFSRSIFSVVSFQDAVFYKNVRFHETIFHNNVDFFNTSFKGLVDFYLVKFEDDQQFHTTDFLDRAIFSNTTFKGEAQFIYNKVDKNSYINFESAKFEKGLDISRANFNCNLNFWNIFIQNKNISEFTKYIDDFGEHKEEATPSVYKQIRETYRIIKDNFYKQNNKIEGLKFYEKEMSAYLEEKRAEDKKSSSTNNFTLRNLSLENKVDKSFANSPIVKKKLTFFSNFFLCFYQVVFLPFYELLPIVEILENILFQFKEIFKNLFSFLHSKFYKLNLFSFLHSKFYKLNLFPFLYNLVFPFLYRAFYKLFFVLYKAFYEIFSFLYNAFYIVIYIIVKKIREFRYRNIILYRSLFCIIILFLFLVYVIRKEYCWFWAFVIIFTLVVLIEFYDSRNDTRKLITSNNYIPLILIIFVLIWFFIVFYGYANYKQDFLYLLIKKIYHFLQTIAIDIDMLIIGFYSIVILSLIFLVVFRKQDKIVLWFNKNSNEFDTNWVAGVNFSLLVGILSYLAVLVAMNDDIELDTSTEGISNFITSLVDVFNLTKWVNLEIIDIRLEGFPYLLLFIGRIFIGYGYYQTIQAFRKFGKS